METLETTTVQPAKQGLVTRARARLAGILAALVVFIAPGVPSFAAAPADPLGGATDALTSQIVAYAPVVLLSVIGVATVVIGASMLFKFVRKAVSAA